MRLDLDLGRVETKCAKKGCRHDGAALHRHHRRSEKFFIGAFARSREGEPKYLTFVKRYESFDPEDIVLLCDWHHREIHERYHRRYQDYFWKLRKAPSQWTWAEAEKLMSHFERICKHWLNTDTPGSPPWPQR